MEIVMYLFAAYLFMLGLGLVASIVGLFVKRWRKYAICYLWWALFPFCFSGYAAKHDIIRKRCKRTLLGFVSPCAMSVYLVTVILVGLFSAMDSSSSSGSIGGTYTMDYLSDCHNSKDLQRLTGVEFPEVILVDSFLYRDAPRVYYVEVKFVPARSMTKKDFEKFDKACLTDTSGWRKDSTGYTYSGGSHRRKVVVDGKIVDECYELVDVFVPLKGDTITYSQRPDTGP